VRVVASIAIFFTMRSNIAKPLVPLRQCAGLRSAKHTPADFLHAPLRPPDLASCACSSSACMYCGNPVVCSLASAAVLHRLHVLGRVLVLVLVLFSMPGVCPPGTQVPRAKLHHIHIHLNKRPAGYPSEARAQSRTSSGWSRHVCSHPGCM
jgi:hypothetical protein